MGGRAGRGWKRICWPFTSTTSSAKHRWSTSSDSSVIFPRRFESRPSARNSSSIQPVPTPSRIRPPDKSCTVASHLAVGKAGLKGRFKTPVPSPIRWVAAAKKANVAKGSRVRIAPSTSVNTGEGAGGKGQTLVDPYRVQPGFIDCPSEFEDQLPRAVRSPVAEVDAELHAQPLGFTTRRARSGRSCSLENVAPSTASRSTARRARSSGVVPIIGGSAWGPQGMGSSAPRRHGVPVRRDSRGQGAVGRASAIGGSGYGKQLEGVAPVRASEALGRVAVRVVEYVGEELCLL